MAPLTRTWRRNWQIGRLRIAFTLMRHRYLQSSDRWVLQPNFVYDRKTR